MLFLDFLFLFVVFLTIIVGFPFDYGRRGVLMVGALGSRSSGPGSSYGWGTALCSWEKHFTFIVPLHPGV